MKICITADIHFEKVLLEDDGFDNIKEYFVSKLNYIKPELFIIAGDFTDSRNLRLETPETAKLAKFLEILLATCNKLKTDMVIMKGTPSHDGDILKNLSMMTSKYSNYTYIDEITRIKLRGLDFVFIPEIYRPTYKQFDEELRAVVDYNSPADIIVFHGMFDFAIPQLMQRDSQHNLSRAVVMKSDDISRMARLVIGGHVHSCISKKNIFYTGRFINERGHSHDGDTYGMKLVTFDTKTREYHIKNVHNAYLIKQVVIELDLTKHEPASEYVRSRCNMYQNSPKDVIYHITITDNEEGRMRLKTFRDIYKPLYLKRSLINVKSNSKEEVTDAIVCETLTVEDLRNIIKETYKINYGEDIPNDILDMIELGDEYDMTSIGRNKDDDDDGDILW